MGKIFIILLSLLAFNMVQAQDGQAKILFTGGTHGRPVKYTDYSGKDIGGIAARKTLINKLTAGLKKKQFVVVDAGGVFGGSPESYLSDLKADMVGMNEAGYNLMGLAPSDVAEGYAGVKPFIETAKFYILCSNIKKMSINNSEEDIADPYKVETINGYKIGFFSVMTDDIQDILNEKAKGELIISEPFERMKEIIENLTKKEKVNAIVGLTSLGYYPDSERRGVEYLAEQFPEINVIIDSEIVNRQSGEIAIGNTVVLPTGRWGHHLGELNLNFKDKKYVDFNVTYHSINLKADDVRLDEDAGTLAAVNKVISKTEALMDKKAAVLKRGELSTYSKMDKLTNLGYMICDAAKSAYKTDAFFVSAGGLAEASFKEGFTFTYATLESVFKYDNYVTIVNIPGRKLKEIIETSYRKIGYGQFLQFAGIELSYSNSKKQILNVTMGGRPIDDNKIYKIGTTMWLAEGGDGYKVLSDIQNKTNTYKNLRSVFYEYLLSKKNLVEEELTAVSYYE